LSVREKVLRLRDEMNGLFLERRDEIDGLFLAILSRNHVFQVGPRGTAKSLTFRSFSQRVDGAEYFEYLMTRFTKPEEIFGPVRLSALKEDRYERNIQGKLPTAHFGFLDEAFKANSAILNSLLTLINERLYHNNNEPMVVPLETLMVASNEIPQEEELAALYDRILLRYNVGYLAERRHFLQVVQYDGPMRLNSPSLTLDDIHQAQEEVRKVIVPEFVLKGVADIRDTLRAQGIQPSDRRYKDAKAVIRAKAWLLNRTECIMDDLSVLRDILWDDPTHIPLVQGHVLEVANPLLKKAEEVWDAILGAWNNLQKVEKDEEKMMNAIEVLSKLKKGLHELDEIRDQGESGGQDMTSVIEHIQRGKELKDIIKDDYLGLDEK
jgi:MoxR-like ATPase